MEQIFQDLRTIHKYRSGPFGSYIQQLAQRLHEQGYAREKAQKHLYTIRDFGLWLEQHRVPLCDLTFEHVQHYLRLDNRWKKTGDRFILKHLLEMLTQDGQIRPVDSPKTQVELIICNFGNYLREECALVGPTIKNRKVIVRAFLTRKFGKRIINLSNIQPGDLIGFVQHEAARRRGSTKDVGTALRSFMRYLLFNGCLNRNLSVAVPTAPNRRLTAIPRFLTGTQVRQVLASCNRRTCIGRRDYAILLLLARLGLRAGEVETLRVEDIDWITGTVTVHGKGDKVRQLPLLHAVGKAISVYIRNGRRSSPDKRIFQSTLAPFHGLKRTVGSIVSFALKRAGVQSPSQGSHQFRHSLASRMLAKGASLAEIGEVLRHESQETTFIYTKIDLGRLRPLAQRWPGGAL